MDTISGQVLIVEDEVNIRTGLRDILTKVGHTITDVGSGEEALVTLASSNFDVAIVDIRMPGMTGIELLPSVRERWPQMNVIMLTGHGDLESAMAAVKAGAYDYLLKPARSDTIRQTVAEAVAAARRRRAEYKLLESLRVGLTQLDTMTVEPAQETPPVAEQRFFKYGDLVIDVRAHEVRRDGRLVHLTPTEFKLLVALSRHPGEVVDYNALICLTMGYEAELWEAKELLKRHVSAIRQKLEPDPAEPRYVLNVRGVGYRLTAPS